MRKLVTITLFLLAVCKPGICADKPDIILHTRGSFLVSSDKIENNMIVPEFFDLRMKGNINENFYYSAYHHLIRQISAKDPLSATDWLYLGYRNGSWGFEMGKLQMENGGFEYDEAPVNMYTHGLYWQNYSFAFSYGINLIRYWDNDKLAFQIFRTPENIPETITPLKSFSLCWKGRHGLWQSKYSANAIYPDGKSALYATTLGNSFTFGKFNVLFDLMLRFPGEAFSAMGKFSYDLSCHFRPFVKLNYDHTFGNPNDILVPDGIDYRGLGAGIEYFPIKDKRDVRFHLLYVYSDCFMNGDTKLFKESFFNFGLTFNVHLSRSGR